MKIRLAVIILMLTCALSLPAQQQQTAHSQTSSDPHYIPNATTAQAKDLAANLAKMRALVQRMQSNLPAVASGQSPLEHEFQLEIEMWQLLIDQMEMQMKAASPPAR